MTIQRATDHHNVMSAIHPKPKPTKEKKVKRVTKIDKEDILSRRDSYLCDCGCGKPGHDLHHAFIGRKAGIPELDDERNLVLVNHDEHISRLFDNQKWRKKFWNMKCYKHGTGKMFEWLESLPKKLSHRTDWL